MCPKIGLTTPLQYDAMLSNVRSSSNQTVSKSTSTSPVVHINQKVMHWTSDADHLMFPLIGICIFILIADIDFMNCYLF